MRWPSSSPRHSAPVRSQVSAMTRSVRFDSSTTVGNATNRTGAPAPASTRRTMVPRPSSSNSSISVVTVHRSAAARRSIERAKL